MSQRHYDYVIVGSGLPGLLLAASLSRFTDNIALLEAQDTFGGCHKKITNAMGSFENGLRFFPDTESSRSALNFAEAVMNLKIYDEPKESQSVFFEGGQFKPFLGFGDVHVDFYDELAYFLSSSELPLKFPVHEWPKRLMENFKGDFLPRSIVTRFQSEEGRVKSVLINGTKTLNGDQFIFCGTFKDLSVLLPTESLSARSKNKLNKTTYWTSICLDILHSAPFENTNAYHVLNGTTQDELGPCFGKLYPPTENMQFSQWISFVDDELSDDSEVTAHALKKMKRQIKRAYPTALDNPISERIFVYSNYAGDGVLKVNENQTIAGLDNLWIASPTINPGKNMVGAIKQAELVVSSLGFSIEKQNDGQTYAEETTIEPLPHPESTL
ncbi:MAG: NAD(P)-binding protein [Bdellovibrionaceae bacterium]|nr:NAD(P)-binding protein [Pseudobdellovibrionaceae bacterium]